MTRELFLLTFLPRSVSVLPPLFHGYSDEVVTLREKNIFCGPFSVISLQTDESEVGELVEMILLEIVGGIWRKERLSVVRCGGLGTEKPLHRCT